MFGGDQNGSRWIKMVHSETCECREKLRYAHFSRVLKNVHCAPTIADMCMLHNKFKELLNQDEWRVVKSFNSN